MTKNLTSLTSNTQQNCAANFRNLRNILECEVSIEHIRMVADHLTNKTAVANSKQLPFRFLAAYKELKAVNSGYTSRRIGLLRLSLGRRGFESSYCNSDMIVQLVERLVLYSLFTLQFLTSVKRRQVPQEKRYFDLESHHSFFNSRLACVYTKIKIINKCRREELLRLWIWVLVQIVHR